MWLVWLSRSRRIIGIIYFVYYYCCICVCSFPSGRCYNDMYIMCCAHTYIIWYTRHYTTVVGFISCISLIFTSSYLIFLHRYLQARKLIVSSLSTSTRVAHGAVRINRVRKCYIMCFYNAYGYLSSFVPVPRARMRVRVCLTRNFLPD